MPTLVNPRIFRILLPAMLWTQSWAQSSDTGLVAHWTFDTGTVVGATVRDSSSSHLNGTLSGAVILAAGKIKQALSFNGTNTSVHFGSESLTDLTGDLSLALWIKTTNKSRLEGIVSRYSAAGLENGYVLRADPSGHLNLRIGGNNLGAGGTDFVDTGRPINDGMWHHAAVVLSMGHGVSFYIDGALSSVQSANISPVGGGAPLILGMNGYIPFGNYLTGSLDDVRIYKRVLQPAEIAILGNAPPPSPVSAFSVSPANASFSILSGMGNAAPQSVDITTSGAGAVRWSAIPNQPWLTVSPPSGSGGQAISLGVNAGSLAPGNYSGTVTISAPGTAPPVQTLDVSLTIADAVKLLPGGNQHYVSPDGSRSGDGSLSRPWDLQTALNQPASVRPGDTIWLRNGVYGNGSTIFTSSLKGSSAQPILVRQYPGERATVNGGLSVSGSDAWFWGFEVTNLSVTNRITGCGGTNCNMMPVGVDVYAPGSKFINMVVHDTAQGFGFWVLATNAEIYGSLIYNNGWQGSDRGHGHGIYTQNQTGTKMIRDNIIFQGLGLGIQAYGSNTAYVENYVLDGNTIFNSGTLSNNNHHDYNLLFAGGHRPKNISVQNTYTYHTPTDSDGLSALDWAASDNSLNLKATNNYWMGGQLAIRVDNWTGATFTNNTSYSQAVTLEAGHLSSATYTWDHNTYYGSNVFQLNSQNQPFSSWTAATGLDAHSTFSSGRPTGTWTFVRPNLYEPGRANITIYNWALAASVPVNVAGILAVGRKYEIRNVQDFFGTAVAAGTYSGGAISIPMTGLTVAKPTGVVPTLPKPTGPEFGVFVLLPQ